MSKMAYAASATALTTTTLTSGVTRSHIALVVGGLDRSAWNGGYGASPRSGMNYDPDLTPSLQQLSRVLLKFDVSSITDTPQSAILNLRGHADTTGEAENFVIARVLRDWGGPADYHWHAALAGESTWNSAMHGSLAWTTAGCDGEDTDRTAFSGEHTLPAGTFWSMRTVNIDVTSTVAAWVAGTYSNYGWVIATTESYGGVGVANALMTFYTGYLDPAFTSTLTIEYYPS